MSESVSRWDVTHGWTLLAMSDDRYSSVCYLNEMELFFFYFF